MMEALETMKPASLLQLCLQRWEDDGGRIVPGGAVIGKREGQDDAWREGDDGATHAKTLPR